MWNSTLIRGTREGGDMDNGKSEFVFWQTVQPYKYRHFVISVHKTDSP